MPLRSLCTVEKAIHANPLATAIDVGIDDAISFTEDHTVGLSSFTIMAGLGGSLGYAMGAFNWGPLGEFCEKHDNPLSITL